MTILNHFSNNVKLLTKDLISPINLSNSNNKTKNSNEASLIHAKIGKIDDYIRKR